MKKYKSVLRFGMLSLPVLFVLLLLNIHTMAQTASTISPATSAALKSQAQTLAPYNAATGGNFASTAVVNRVSTPLSLTTGQNKSMNSAIYNFLNAKGAINNLKWSNPSAYQQKLTGLIEQLTGNLSGFLSTNQVNQFVAMKPATAKSRDPLVMVFY